MGRREELARAEDAGWAELAALVRRLSSEQMEEPGMTPDGWSVKDLLWHIGCWSGECARTLERIRMGTFEERDVDVDSVNREWFEMSRTLDLETVRTGWISSRNRMLQEWAALPQITPQADEWFYESGPEHYADHMADLRAWVELLTTPR